MKIKCLILVQLFLTYFSFSQDKDSNKGWYYGPNISGVITQGYYNKSEGFWNNSTNLKNYNSYSGGVDAMYAFGRKHTLTFGVHYQEFHYSNNLYWESDPLNNPGKMSNAFRRYSSKYLLLPVHMDFCLLKGKLSPYIMTGLSPYLFLSSKSFYRETDLNGIVEETNYYDYHKRLDVSWQIGLGLDVNLNKSKLRVFVYESGYQPFFFYTFGSWGYLQFNFRGGISYYFKK